MIKFGSSNTDFKPETLKQLIEAGKIEEAKDYVNCYFVKLRDPLTYVLCYSPARQKYTIEKECDIIKMYLKRSFTNGKFSISKWFSDENLNSYYFDCDPTQPAYYEKNGIGFINSFVGYKHKQYKPYKEYSDEIKKGVSTIWDHIYTVWCNKQEDQFKYTKQWIINMVNGQKMVTILYLRAGQGVGKSIITDFLMLKVLGKDICYTTSDPNIVRPSAFNNQLVGKIFLDLEEMPTDSGQAWNSLANNLKDKITNKLIEIHTKNKDSYTITNYLSIILNTNNNAQKLSIDDRRNEVLDVSNEKVENYPYFDKLNKCTDSDEVGEAFYSYCKENFVKDYPFNIIPKTQAKKDLINEYMPELLKYIKDTYVLRKIGIDVLFSKFYHEYSLYCQSKKKEAYSKIVVSKQLKENKINTKEKGANKKYVVMSKEDLYNLYQKKDWIHETDEFVNEDEIVDEPDPLEYGIMQPEKKQEEKQQENKEEKKPEPEKKQEEKKPQEQKKDKVKMSFWDQIREEVKQQEKQQETKKEDPKPNIKKSPNQSKQAKRRIETEKDNTKYEPCKEVDDIFDLLN